MLKNIDLDVNPCYDYYKYACGNWEKSNAAPAGKTEYDVFEKLRENLSFLLRNLLTKEDPIIDQEELSESGIKKQNNPFVKAKKYYKSCMNQDVIDSRAEMPLLLILQNFGGWPVLDDDWDETNFDWLWLVAQIRLYDCNIFILEWVGPDYQDSSSYLLQIDQSSLGLPTREHFLDESNRKYLEAYRIYMITVANLCGVPILKATENADEMIDFEIRLAQISIPESQRQYLNKIYHRMTVGKLEGVVPQIDWIRYLKILTGRSITHEEPIGCFCLKYFQRLARLISRTPSRVLANYIIWRFIRNRISNLDSRFLEARKRFRYVLDGTTNLRPKWKRCVSQVNSHMAMAVGYLFVKQYYDGRSKNDTMDLIQSLQKTFYNMIPDMQWLDNEAKILSQKKIEAMQMCIGYPDILLDKKEVAAMYNKLEIVDDRFFENTVNTLHYLAKLEHARLHIKVDKSIWNTTVADVNAYYCRNKNQILFPAGILQPPFYHKYFPRSVNYGGIGVVIGHEMTHGFDASGRLFDTEGNIHSWWNDRVVEAFNERSQCLIDQYNSYIMPETEEPLDGLNTQNEDIADNGGLKQAYKAYKQWCEENPDVDESLPGLNISNEQLFFLSFAQIWCGTSRVESTHSKMKEEVHSPGRYRVIGTVRNSLDFSRVYGCPVGSPMNPEQKCVIW